VNKLKKANQPTINRFLPILEWLPKYNRTWLITDILAGLTLLSLVVPEGMAYAGIADLPPQFGLYTLVASLLIYALFGSSRHLTVGATSASAALMASTVIALGVTTSDMPTYQAYSVTLVLVIGVIFLVAGLARLGWVTQFLSKPVMDGFVVGLAIFVAVGQLNKLFGVEKGEGTVFQKLFAIIKQLPEANWVTFAVGASALALLFLTPLFTSLPEAVLAALFIHAIWHILTARKLEKIRLISRAEFWLTALTLLGVLFIGIQEGMIIGLVASVLLNLYQSSRPHLASLGRVPGLHGVYSDLKRHPENTAHPGILIVRLDAPIYYANALTVRVRLKALKSPGR
jgi:SulP family sulfate permease